MNDEILDLVNKFDQVIGTIKRSQLNEVKQKNLGYFRASDLFIINNDGKLWIPTRTATKKIAPNAYDFSAAGHVSAGEDYLETIIRETKEEINLNITESELEFIAKFVSPELHYIDSIFLLRSDKTPTHNPSDFASAEWLTPQALLANIANGHKTKSSLPIFVNILQQYLSKNI